MNKYIASSVLSAAILISPALALAQVQGDTAPIQGLSSCISLQYNLQYRSTGAAVSLLQDFLQSNGYLNSEPTGYFGLLTLAAVKGFQAASGILNSGYVGPVTRAKIKDVSCGSSTTAVSPTSAIGSVGTSNLPAGCLQGHLYSPLTGQRCIATQSSYPSGCTSTVGYSPTTGYKCDGTATNPITETVHQCPNGAVVFGSNSCPSYTTTAPTCTIVSNKNSYKLGETITYSWTSQNATYASFQQDTSGKDHLWLPGDKLSANGSQQVVANVIGNPPVTLTVSGVNNGTGSCSTVVNVETTSQPSITVTYPQAGNSLENSGAKNSGLIANIQWNEQNGNYPVNIWLLNQSSQVVRTIGTNVPNTGSYPWNYDSALIDGVYQIRIDVLYPSGVSGQDSAYSGYFSISQSSLSQVPTIYYFLASLASISSGQPVTLSWSSSGSNCSVLKNESNGGYTTIDYNAGSATTYSVSPSVTTTYTLQCLGSNSGTGKDGPSAFKSVTISVSNPAPTCTITPSSPTPSMPTTGYDYSVKPNSSLTLTWTSQNASYVTVQGEKQATNGSITYDNLTAITNDYSMTAYGSSGTATCNAKVYVDYKG